MHACLSIYDNKSSFSAISLFFKAPKQRNPSGPKRSRDFIDIDPFQDDRVLRARKASEDHLLQVSQELHKGPIQAAKRGEMSCLFCSLVREVQAR
jgi:hypothetical protein